MNTNCGKYLWNGERINCWAGSPNYKWLQNDLAGWKAANPSPSCVAVIGHALRFSSGAHGNTKNQHAYWKLFYNNRVDVVLNGHDHDYERFAPQRSIKTVKSDGTKVLSSIADANGPREFVWAWRQEHVLDQGDPAEQPGVHQQRVWSPSPCSATRRLRLAVHHRDGRCS
jgi:hypothetical protein